MGVSSASQVLLLIHQMFVAQGQPGHLRQNKGWKWPQIPGSFPLEHSGKRRRGFGDFGSSQQSWGTFWSPPGKHPGVFSLEGYPFLTAPPEDAAAFGKSSPGCSPAHPLNPEKSDHGYQPRHRRESFQKPFPGSQANLGIILETRTELPAWAKNANSRQNSDGKHGATLAPCVSSEHCLASCADLRKKFWHGMVLQIKHPTDCPPHVRCQGAGVLCIPAERFQDPGVT